MLRRVEIDDPASLAAALGTPQSEPIVPAAAEADFDAPLLPHDHPKWVRDALSVSNRARELIARLPRVTIAVLTFWDHHIRSILVSGSRVSIDASGSYRAE